MPNLYTAHAMSLYSSCCVSVQLMLCLYIYTTNAVPLHRSCRVSIQLLPCLYTAIKINQRCSTLSSTFFPNTVFLKRLKIETVSAIQ